MLRIVTGHYHPDLEQALVEEIRSLKSTDPFAPLAIVVPSDPLKHRLKQLLCVEQQLALLDVHVLTFHQLALHLYSERQAAGLSGPEEPQLPVVPDLVWGHLLRHIVRRQAVDTRSADLASSPSGVWSALWSTVRDLKDAMVDPAEALRGVDDGLFGADDDDANKLRELFTRYAAVQEVGRALKIGSADDLAASVRDWAPSSPFLSRLARVCYYGFYDLTQVQLSFFESIARCAPATLYFPFGDGEPFAFARQFFERYLAPLVPAPGQVVRLGLSDASKRNREMAGIQVLNAVGADDELAAACKAILTLVETNGYRFEEIGVVARGLEPYRTSLRHLFDEHRIPFVTTASAPLLQEPAAKVVLQLAVLPLTKFYRAPVLDVLTSPCYRMNYPGGKPIEPRPDLWLHAVQSLGITRGEEEWRRLASTGEMQTWQGDGEWEGDEGIDGQGGIHVDAPQVRLLSHLVSRLIEDCRRLPLQGGVGELTDAFLTLVRTHVTVPGLDADGEDDGEAVAPSRRTGQAIGRVLSDLCQLDRLGETVSWEEWAGLFAQAMEGASVPIEPFAHAGVQVLDAMAARGLPFRALFLLGLNEKVFPRTIREDAFLRDRSRRALSETLGYKIDEKLGGHEEERLLFELLTWSARDRLYLCYQRADADGRPLAMSSYLDALLRDRAEPARAPDIVVPRRLSDRLKLPLFAPPLLTREELSVGLVLRGHDPSALLDAVGRGALIFGNGAAALRELEAMAGGLGPYDGLTGPLDRRWAALAERGLAPTPLEQYARCPFQYFSAQVLKLEPVRERPGAELPARALGELCHAILSRCYRQWRDEGWPQRAMSDVARQTGIGDATEAVFAEYAGKHGAGYPLLWRIAKDVMAALVTAAAAADEQEFRVSGFRPEAFEVDAAGSLESVGGQELKGILVRGRLDRVDRRETPPGLRVVDYKYRHGNAMKDEDKNLVVSAVRGYRLQPPLYAAMMPKGIEPGGAPALLPEAVEFMFLAPRWENQVGRASFNPSVWAETAGRTIAQTLRTLIEGIRSGQYFVLPDGYCDHCEFTAACRRFHGPTWWRAHTAPAARRLRHLRKQKVEKT
ncbi:MAG: hypothetical protein EXR96_01020 [Nitrospiraceae bacterium]|nr:hypothetical protein [Nitrospiraceae bacterium]